MVYESSTRRVVVLVPVCLNCGIAIEPGIKFCDGCRGYGRDVEVRDLVELARNSGYVPARYNNRRWLLGGLLVLCGMLVLGSYALIASIPSGSKGKAGYQASLCRKNLENIQAAVRRYYDQELEYPASGTVDSESQLVRKGYVEPDTRCPSTSRFYILESRDGEPAVVCDGGPAGHCVEQ